MILIILKWYAIISVVLSGLFNLWEGIKDNDREDLVSFLFLVPVLIYLIIC